MDRTRGANYITVNNRRLFTDGPPGTAVDAVFLNSVQEEIANTIEYSGTTLNATLFTQLRDAIIYLIRNSGIYAIDTGAADVYVITPTPALGSYVPGIAIWWQATHNNTGSSTLNISGLGAKTLKKNGNQNLVAGDILANQVICCTYDGVNMQVTTISLNLGGANGIATLDGSSHVVQEPASKAQASGIASLDGASKVVQTALLADAAVNATNAVNATGAGTALYCAEVGLKKIRGFINAGGGINAGTGFTVAPGVTGVYTVTINPAFSGSPAYPVVTATIVSTGTGLMGRWCIEVTYMQYNTIIFYITRDGVPTNCGFCFEATGLK
jgi:hypothetical protein